MLTGLVTVFCGCSHAPTIIDSLSNNTSGDMVRGVNLQAGVDIKAGNPVPSVSFTMGSLARKGKGDRTVIVIDNNTTDIVSESYSIDVDYVNTEQSIKDGRQLLAKERRTASAGQFDEGIFVHQTSDFGMGVTAGNLLSAGGHTLISIGKVGTNTAAATAKDKNKETGK